MIPTKPKVMEISSESLLFDRFAVHDMPCIVTVGVIKSLEKDPFGDKLWRKGSCWMGSTTK